LRELKMNMGLKQAEFASGAVPQGSKQQKLEMIRGRAAGFWGVFTTIGRDLLAYKLIHRYQQA